MRSPRAGLFGMVGEVGVGEDGEREEGVVHFVGVADRGPRPRRFLGDGVGAEGAEVAGVVGEGAAERYGAGAALLEGGVVEEGVGHRVEQLVGEHGGLGRVFAEDLDLAVFDAAEHVQHALGVERLREAVAERFEHEGVVGGLDPAVGREVVLAGGGGGEDGGEEVVGAHSLDGRGDALAARLPEEREGAGGRPSPAQREDRRLQDGLREDVLGGGGVEVMEDGFDGEGVLGAERDVDALVGCGGLQFEVESGAEALAEGEPPCAVEAASERGVDDQLHAAGLVEEAFGDEFLGGGDDAKRSLAFLYVGDDLLGGLAGRAALHHEGDGGVADVEALVDVAAEGGDFA